jgi:predicted transcriptional regulator
MTEHDTLQIHVGETMEQVAQRFLDGWARIERGEDVREKHVSFATWDVFIRTMTPKRLELLRHVHRSPTRSIRALAQALGRDYRRVHEDVVALVDAGLLERDEDGLRAGYDSFHAETRIAL